LVEDLHREVDAQARAVAGRHGARLRCRLGCSGCCVDGLTVFEVEAQRIRAEFSALLRDAEPHPPGACAFLDAAGGCRIYAARPYVCRTQGLPLRYFEELEEDGDIVEHRDICPENADGPPLSTLDDDDCWLIGPFEERLMGIQESEQDPTPPLQRVALRALFNRSGS
jgi:hypothetical protein